MAHPRKLIRHAVVALLTNATAAGARVKDTRVEPHRKGALPAIAVYTLREPVNQDVSGGAPLELTRDVKVEIAGFVGVRDPDTVADELDDLAEQIEAAMDNDRYLGGLAADSILESTEMQVREEDGASDPLIGIITLTYSVTYQTSPAVPDDLEDFLRVGAEHRIVGAVAANAANDAFTVQETP
ncbi:MAG TPA: hypothetical protein VFO62_10325 [Candidatus Binatia bacterium]|nr:hypothetical protein [Candidatus Binatia bacterium]